MGYRTYAGEVLGKAGELWAQDWGVSVKKTALIPVLFLMVGLVSHFLSGNGNPLDELNVWIHYTLVPTVVLGIPFAVWYVGRSPYALTKEKEAKLETVIADLKGIIEGRPHFEYRRAGLLLNSITGDDAFLVFPAVSIYNTSDRDLVINFYVRLWENRHGLGSGLSRMRPGVPGTGLWENLRESLSYPPLAAFHPNYKVGAFKNATGYVAVPIGGDDRKLLLVDKTASDGGIAIVELAMTNASESDAVPPVYSCQVPVSLEHREAMRMKVES